jgi:hypothetical protein
MRRTRRWRQRIAGSARSVRLVALLSLLAVMIVAFAIALATQTSSQPQPESRVKEQWISLTSTSAADVLAAARATTLYREVAAHPETLLGQAVRAGSLGTPQLVHVFRPRPGMYDVWVIPLTQSNVPGLSAPGPHVVGMLDLDYDAAHHCVRAVSFAGPLQPGDPAYGRPFPQQTQQAAAAAFANTTHAQMAVNLRPELVYFPADLDAIAGVHATLHWTAGGQFADLAVWHVRSADGHDFIAGLDGRVYAAEQLPLAKGAAGHTN